MVSDTPHYENLQVGEANEVPFEIPENWEWCNVSDIFELNPKNNVPDDTQSGFIPMACVDDGFGYAHSFETRPWGEIRKGYSHFQNGDIGIAKISPCFENRKSTIFYDLPNGIGAGTTELTVLRGHCVNIEFYLYLFQSEWYIFEGTKEFKGVVGQQRVNKEIFTTLLIPLPPIEEQNRIVTEIKKWFSLIDTLETAKEDLQTSIAQAKSRILDLAIHGKLVPQDPNDEPAIELLKRINPKFTPCDNAHCQYRFPICWELVKLEDVCEFIRNGVSIRQIKGANGIPITRIETISNGIVDRDRMGYAEIIDDTYEKYYLQHGDILMSHINSPIHVGKSALYESIEGEKIIHGMNLLCLRMKTGICPKYMNYLFMSEIFKDEIRPYIKNAVNQASINTRNLGGVYSPIPPYNEQQRIVTKIEELFAVLDEIQKSIEA